MSAIKRFLLIFSSVIIALCSFILPASAVDSTYTFNVPEPISSGMSGYIVNPIYGNNSYIPSFLIAWQIFPIMNYTDINAVGSNYFTVEDGYSAVTSTVTNDTFLLTFDITNQGVGNYYVHWFIIYNGDTSPLQRGGGVFNHNGTYTVEFDISDLIDTSRYPNAYFGVADYYTGCTPLFLSTRISNFTYNCLFGGDVSFYEKLTTINSNIVLGLSKLDKIDTSLNSLLTHFITLLSKVDYTNEQLDTIVSQFTDLLELTNTISVDLGDFIYVYWDTFANSTFPEHISAVIAKLEQIRRLLAAKGDVEQTTVNSDKFDQYADIEQSLVNNEDAESAIADLDVSIDGDSYSFIWDLITSILNSHPEVFGLVITILTLGFLALILNR